MAVCAWTALACASQSAPAPTVGRAPSAAPTPGSILAPSGPPVLGIDWARAAPVERPAGFDFASTPPPFNGGPGHPLHNPGQAMMADVVAVQGGRFVSIGYAYPGWHPVAWTSPDGDHWSLRQMGSTEFTFPVAMAIGSDGTIVAVGRSGSRPVAWTSSDRGDSWSEHDVPTLGDGSVAERMTSVVATGDGFVAGGSAGPELAGRHARFWRSPDGVTWRPDPDAAHTFDDAEVRGLAVAGDAIVAVGVLGSAQEATGSVAWRSSGATTWERIDDPSLATGKALAVATTPWGGFVAVGSDLDRRQADVWSSADGSTWTRSVDESSRQGGNGYAWMTDVIPLGNQLVAIGDYQDLQRPTALSWVSSDAQHWTRSREAPVQQQAEFYAVDAGGPGIIAVGSYGSPDEYIPTVWKSPGRE